MTGMAEESPEIIAARAYADNLVAQQVEVMATKNALVATASMPGAIAAGRLVVRPTFNSNFSVLVASFPLKIVSVALVQSIATIPRHAQNFMAATWRKVTADGSFSTVADHRTNTEAWTVHRPWTFDQEVHAEEHKTLQAGDGLNLAFSVAGSGYYLFPIYVTVRYVPL